ncbi:hypothetical protein V6N13_040832 [Hibiscus sabdariffa]|uniref:Uncharacterized protein n=1 Tax=Hibiscus sabdariffa TaxID=183260 RepID=A0ABR2RA99_9ROSI
MKMEQLLLDLPVVGSSAARHNFRFFVGLLFVLFLLPTENIGGSVLPRASNHPRRLHNIELFFTLTGSLIALFIEDDSKTSRFCALCSTVAMVSALASIVYACFACLITLLVIL